MKFVIAVDCEGPACVVGNVGKALSESSDFLFAREQATRETNAAARALFDAGAADVLVWDSHGQGVNLLVHKLDPRCRIVLGRGFPRRFPGLDNTFAGVVMIGYHAMEGTENAVLAHTYSSEVYKRIRVNGQEVGEIALDASVAGEMGVPVLFVSSDDHGCSEALAFMPWIESVVTKQGLGRNCALSRHPRVAEDAIYQKVRHAADNIPKMQLLTFSSPVRMDIRFKTISQSLKALVYRRRGWRMKGMKTIATEFDSMLEWNC